MKQLKALYDRGENVMQLFRESESAAVNSREAIMASYDLQAGSYVELLQNPARAEHLQNYSAALAGVLDRYSPMSVMEAGVGEATTLTGVLRQIRHQPEHALGFDISWSRIAVARSFTASNQVQSRLFISDLSAISVEDNSVDTVFTSHSIEPNRGREKEILRELFRVTRHYLVLLEPSNELGTEATKQHIEKHKYCLNLHRHAKELGFNVIEHRLFDYTSNPQNQTGLLIIEKAETSGAYQGDFLACPACHCSLTLHKGNYFCTECLVVYPVIGGIPCLSVANGVLATRYFELAKRSAGLQSAYRPSSVPP